ncbi:MAG: T9SS type A sorting domain-containing protein [Chitinophagaceae bacterium]|nr:T9SS type A sorting domain-containing protein [Chitinophagaceae bacterium]
MAITAFLLSFQLFAQTSPGGIAVTNPPAAGLLRLWLRADRGVFTDAAGTTVAGDGQRVERWSDQSAGGLHALQTLTAGRPTFTSAGFNGFPAISFSSPNLMVSPLNIRQEDMPRMTILIVGSHNTGGAVRSKLFGQDAGGFQRSFGYDNRTTTTFGYLTGAGVRDFGNVPAIQPFLAMANYRSSSFYGSINGALLVDGGPANSSNGRTELTIGAVTSTGGAVGVDFWDGRIAEMIVFDRTLQQSEFTICQNYLAAKYNIVLDNAADVYKMDDPVNGDFDYDVVGIGSAFGGGSNTAAGGGMLGLRSAMGMTLNSYLIAGHNNLPATPDGNSVPAGVSARFPREWAASVTGTITGATVDFDLTGYAVAASDLRLLIDRNSNGSLSDETAGVGVISGATQVGNTFSFAAVPISNGQRFTLGSANGFTTLPVELANFVAVRDKGTDRLEWTTGTEKNSGYFEIQRSYNGAEFTAIGKVNAAGNSINRNTYTFTAAGAGNQLTYYRLKIVDIDGKSEFSKIVKIDKADIVTSFKISPNPVSNILNIKDLSGTSTEISITDMSGRIVEKIRISGSTSTIDLSKLARGKYFITIKDAQRTATESFIKQ